MSFGRKSLDRVATSAQRRPQTKQLFPGSCLPQGAQGRRCPLCGNERARRDLDHRKAISVMIFAGCGTQSTVRLCSTKSKPRTGAFCLRIFRWIALQTLASSSANSCGASDRFCRHQVSMASASCSASVRNDELHDRDISRRNTSLPSTIRPACTDSIAASKARCKRFRSSSSRSSPVSTTCRLPTSSSVSSGSSSGSSSTTRPSAQRVPIHGFDGKRATNLAEHGRAVARLAQRPAAVGVSAEHL